MRECNLQWRRRDNASQLRHCLAGIPVGPLLTAAALAPATDAAGVRGAADAASPTAQHEGSHGIAQFMTRFVITKQCRVAPLARAWMSNNHPPFVHTHQLLLESKKE